MPDWLRVLIYGGGGALVLEGARTVFQRKQMGADVGKKKADTVDVNVTIAGKIRDDAVEDWERARGELTALRREFDQHRADTNSEITQLHTELRAERAKNIRLEGDNSRLRSRVDELEAEVGRLREGR